MSAVAIVSPGYPGQTGGVRDHTARLIRHWAAARETLVLGDIGVGPEEAIALWRARRVTGALLQYVPFLYGRRGLSRFPVRLARAAQRAGIRLTVFVHEPWVPPTRLPWLVLSPLQRRQLRELLGQCAAAVTAVPAWVPLLGGDAKVIPVGSTLGDPPGDIAGPPLAAPVLFSPLAAGLAWPWIVAAAQAVAADPPLIVIGADAEAASRHHTAGRWVDPRWEFHGFLEPRAVLTLLARAPLVLAPFVDGLTGRRTSALAALSTGARIVSSRGHLFDASYELSPVRLASTAAEFAETARRTWAEPDEPSQRAARTDWYREHLDPATLDARLLRLVLGTDTA